MSHPRTPVRHAVIAALSAVPGLDVRSGRSVLAAMPKGRDDVVAVANAAEQSGPAPRCGTRRRLLTLELVGLVRTRDGQDVDDDLDALTDKMEAALDADPTLGGLVVHLDLARTDFDAAPTDGAAAMAVQTWSMRIV